VGQRGTSSRGLKATPESADGALMDRTRRSRWYLLLLGAALLATATACSDGSPGGEDSAGAAPTDTTAAASGDAATGDAATGDAAAAPGPCDDVQPYELTQSVSYVAPAASNAAPKGGTFTFAAEGEPTGFNYVQVDDQLSWTQYMMQWTWPGLYSYDPQLKPMLNAELASVDVVSTDPQVVVVTLNPEAVWSDGTPVTVDDLHFTWLSQNGRELTGEQDEDGNDIPKYQAASDNGYKDICSVEAGADDRQAVITFGRPYADWPVLFAPILPHHAFVAAGGGDDATGFNEGFKVETVDLANVPSAGPYSLVEQKPGQGLTLERNAKYWGTPAQFDTVVFPYITDGTQQPAALASGEVDGAFPQAQIDLIKQLGGLAPDVTTEVGFGSFYEHLDFNGNNPALADVRVRQAIAKAIDRQLIVDALPKQVSDQAQVLENRLVFPGVPGYQPNGDADYGTADPAAAEALLAEAGYGPDNRLALRIEYVEPNERRQQTAELIQGFLSDIGIDATLDPRPDYGWLPEGDFDLALYGWSGGTAVSASESIYTEEGAQNLGQVAVDGIQAMFDENNQQLDPARRMSQLNEIDAKLWVGMQNLPLFVVPEVLATRSTTGGTEYNGYQGPTWNMPIWKLK
jgi:peptide/nickel transport system substrate-binding protein